MYLYITVIHKWNEIPGSISDFTGLESWTILKWTQLNCSLSTFNGWWCPADHNVVVWLFSPPTTLIFMLKWNACIIQTSTNTNSQYYRITMSRNLESRWKDKINGLLDNYIWSNLESLNITLLGDLYEILKYSVLDCILSWYNQYRPFRCSLSVVHYFSCVTYSITNILSKMMSLSKYTNHSPYTILIYVLLY